MSATEVILLQRVEKLGQMGDVVKVKPGFARNYLLPQGKAIRSTAANRERFERERSQLEAQNIKRREEAERLLERLQGLTVVIIRQAGESGSLYGSVTARDIREAAEKEGLTIRRQQVEIAHPIKALGLYQVKVQLHPEVHLDVNVNVARSVEEAERQAKGEATQIEVIEEVVAVEEVNAELLEDAPAETEQTTVE
ncbi:50S ribosomal protein L9 [Commensalibacter oyaizuii]|uniref:Large ribosomal subunit protein bL9 n=1 Tax=Commensalibacter oyaizuii TaxID=3043873 RepID=A0ABT6Q0I9_9PROT|nr:50S ribosomal protein L9 [Commensalibacter sp. TBRC 16381]MDI2090628.1 50S ribosomal protein L9 [Commensalibacter sp. TBRC 16381]